MSAYKDYIVKELAPKTWLINEFELDYMYLVEGEKRALVIDTGTGVGDFKGVIESLTKLPYEVVATHGHLDHIGGRGQFEEIYIHPADISMVKEASYVQRQDYAKAILAKTPNVEATFDINIPIYNKEPELIEVKEGDTFDLGGRSLKVLQGYAHTPGSILLFDPLIRSVFSGDAYNPYFLLGSDGTYKEVLDGFLKGAKRMLNMKNEIDNYYGGHGAPIDPRTLPDLVSCAEGILASNIKAEDILFLGMKGDSYSFGTVKILCNLTQL